MNNIIETNKLINKDVKLNFNNFDNKLFNKIDENKTEKNKTDKNKTDKNKTDKNKTDENKTDENKTNENKIDENIKYIIDPLSVIIKLLILSKKPIGSKLCVHKNILYIQNIGFFQSFVRYYFQNKKFDIQYLYNPIEIASLNFLNKDVVRKYPNIKNLFLNAQKGLENLIKTYNEYTFITHTLYMYSNIISNHLGDKYNDKLFIKDNLSYLYSDEIVENLNSIWDENKIKILLNMVEFLDSANSSNDNIKFLEEFMISIDKDVEMKLSNIIKI